MMVNVILKNVNKNSSVIPIKELKTNDILFNTRTREILKVIKVKKGEIVVDRAYGVCQAEPIKIADEFQVIGNSKNI